MKLPQSIRRNWQHWAGGIFLFLCVVIAFGDAYWTKAWRNVAEDHLLFERIPVLAKVVDGINAYRNRYSQWPDALADVEEFTPEVTQLPTTGPERVEYVKPERDGDIVLKSYGHLETRPGWNLKRDPVILLYDTEGSWHRVTMSGRIVR